MRSNTIQQFIKLHRQLSEERGTLEARLREINEALGEMPLPSMAPIEGVVEQGAHGGEGSGGTRRGKRGGMSAAGRARIAAAQRARWAKLKRAPGAKPATSTTAKPRRKMSPAARKAIADAARKRWAAAKAAGRSRL